MEGQEERERLPCSRAMLESRTRAVENVNRLPSRPLCRTKAQKGRDEPKVTLSRSLTTQQIKDTQKEFKIRASFASDSAFNTCGRSINIKTSSSPWVTWSLCPCTSTTVRRQSALNSTENNANQSRRRLKRRTARSRAIKLYPQLVASLLSSLRSPSTRTLFSIQTVSGLAPFLTFELTTWCSCCWLRLAMRRISHSCRGSETFSIKMLIHGRRAVWWALVYSSQSQEVEEVKFYKRQSTAEAAAKRGWDCDEWIRKSSGCGGGWEQCQLSASTSSPNYHHHHHESIIIVSDASWW